MITATEEGFFPRIYSRCGRMVKEGNLLSPHLRWLLRVLVWSGPMRTLFSNSWHHRAAALSPFSLPEMPQMEQKGRDGGVSGLVLDRSGEKV